MSYTLYRLAPGAYDLDLEGIVIGSVVKNEPPEWGWRAELLNSAVGRPAPFTDTEHTFTRFVDILNWLGEPEVKDDNRSPPT